MMDIPTLRKLGTAQPLPSQETLAEACLQAADVIEDLCKQIDGCVRVAADALQRAKAHER